MRPGAGKLRDDAGRQRHRGIAFFDTRRSLFQRAIAERGAFVGDGDDC